MQRQLKWFHLKNLIGFKIYRLSWFNQHCPELDSDLAQAQEVLIFWRHFFVESTWPAPSNKWRNFALNTKNI